MRLLHSDYDCATFDPEYEIIDAIQGSDVLVFDIESGIAYTGSRLGGDQFCGELEREVRYFLSDNE